MEELLFRIQYLLWFSRRQYGNLIVSLVDLLDGRGSLAWLLLTAFIFVILPHSVSRLEHYVVVAVVQMQR